MMQSASLSQATLDAYSAKRLLGLVQLGCSSGAIATGLLVGPLAAALGTDALILVQVGILLLSLVPNAFIATAEERVARSGQRAAGRKKKSSAADGAGWHRNVLILSSAPPPLRRRRRCTRFARASFRFAHAAPSISNALASALLTHAASSFPNAAGHRTAQGGASRQGESPAKQRRRSAAAAPAAVAGDAGQQQPAVAAPSPSTPSAPSTPPAQVAVPAQQQPSLPGNRLAAIETLVHGSPRTCPQNGGLLLSLIHI